MTTLDRDEYVSRWNTYARFALGRARALWIATMVLAALADWLAFRKLADLFVWAALGTVGYAAGWAAVAFWARSRATDPRRLPHTWRDYAEEPPNAERAP